MKLYLWGDFNISPVWFDGHMDYTLDSLIYL